MLELKKFLWLICKVLGLFVNPLTAGEKYSLLNRGNLLQHFQIHSYKKRKIFCEFFLIFSKFRVNFEHFQKKDDLHSWCIFEFTDSEILSEMSKKSCFRGLLDKGHGKRAEHLLKSERQHLYQIYWSLWRILELKKPLWVICKVLGLFLNPLKANDKDSLLNRGNLLQHFQMQVSEKGKTLS